MALKLRNMAILMSLFTSVATSCEDKTGGSTTEAGDEAEVRTLVLAAYTTPREVYGKVLIPVFEKYWKDKTGETIEIKQSYLGSGAQSRAVVGGFEADVVALSLEPDVKRIEEAGLITHDWKKGSRKGMVTRSVVVIGVRKGNPKQIKNWDDLVLPGLKVLTPNVKTSGGAMWNVSAIYGAAMRGHTSATKEDEKSAEELLSKILANVSIMDKGARESMLTFENGVGDAVITYENEMLVSRKMGRSEAYVIPPSTIIIENPVAVVDAYADKHGVRDMAEAFVEFLFSEKSQTAYSEYGLRSMEEKKDSSPHPGYPPLSDVFTIDDFGGWSAVTPLLFGEGGVYDRALVRATAGK